MKLKKLFVLSLSVIACCFFATAFACSGETNQKKYDHRVTFDYNLGKEIEADVKTQYLGVMDNSLVALKPGARQDFTEYTIPEHWIEGWYTAKTDTDGNPIIDEESGRVVIDRKWLFETDRVTGDITLYANVRKRPVLTFINRVNGEIVKTVSGLPGETVSKFSSSAAPKTTGYTLLDYFVSETGDERFSWPFVFEGETRTTAYVDFIEGENWFVVRSASEFNSALRNGAKIYVDSDIDFEKDGWEGRSFYNNEIRGNGHKFSGISISKKFEGKPDPKYLGLFEQLGAKAIISDITFENIKITANVSVGVENYVGTLCGWALSGAKISGVTVSGTIEYEVKEGFDLKVNEWIAKNEIAEGDVIDCDYSGVTIKSLTAE